MLRVEEFVALFEWTYTFMFVAITDDKTCDLCMKFDKMIVNGADIERMFPYATQVDYTLWMVNLHPHCRCMLVLLEIGF
ncbi:phage head morphogenesis protein [Candidatus Bathyarchaeota archaeon]|nr:phage head morphogenesis protein [Candidatus Bathyarchaeota archaeon]